MRSEILLVSTSPVTVAADGVVPVGSIVRRFGPGFVTSSSGVTLTAPGYYDVFVGLTIAPAASGEVTASLTVNGAPYVGASGTVTAMAASEAHSIVIPTCVRVMCGEPVTLNVTLNGTSAVTSYTLMVSKD